MHYLKRKDNIFLTKKQPPSKLFVAFIQTSCVKHLPLLSLEKRLSIIRSSKQKKRPPFYRRALFFKICGQQQLHTACFTIFEYASLSSAKATARTCTSFRSRDARLRVSTFFPNKNRSVRLFPDGRSLKGRRRPTLPLSQYHRRGRA
jgi:hypothetical protein